MLRRCKTYLIALLAVVVCGCDPAFEPPVPTSLGGLRGLYSGYPAYIAQECIVEGVVVSSDRYGNFQGRLALQDSTGGMFFSIDHRSLYEYYSVGDRLSVNCTGLCIGAYGNSVQVGGRGDDFREVSPISLAEWLVRCSKVGEEEPVVPRVTIGCLTADHIATAVELERVRFVEAGNFWADLAAVSTATLVDVESSSDTLRIRLSPRGIYYDAVVPAGECRVVGVVDYFSHSYQLLIESPNSVVRSCDF